MLLINAIQLLAPYHTALVTCIVRKQNSFDAQLSTGHPDLPFIAVNDGEVSASDLMEVLDLYESEFDPAVHELNVPHDSIPNYQEPTAFFDLSTTLDTELWGCAYQE